MVDQLDTTFKSLFPNEAHMLVRNQIAHTQGEPPLALLSLGAVMAVSTSSHLLVVVINAGNRTDGVKETRSFVRFRLTAMAMTFLQSACRLGSLVAIMAWPPTDQLFTLRARRRSDANARGTNGINMIMLVGSGTAPVVTTTEPENPSELLSAACVIPIRKWFDSE